MVINPGIHDSTSMFVLTAKCFFLCAPEDGSVDYEEFEAFVAKNGLYKASVEEVSQELKDAFQVFDRDGDGYIDVDEFKSVMMNIGKLKI